MPSVTQGRNKRQAHPRALGKKAAEKPGSTNFICPNCGTKMLLLGVLPRTGQSPQEPICMCTLCAHLERKEH